LTLIVISEVHLAQCYAYTHATPVKHTLYVLCLLDISFSVHILTGLELSLFRWYFVYSV